MPHTVCTTQTDNTALITFATRRFAQGGGTGEAIRTAFGLTPMNYFSLLAAALHQSELRTEDPRLHQVLAAICRRRLWLGE